MIRKATLTAGLLAVVGSLGGCFSVTDWDENARMANKWKDDANDMRMLTNKYFFNYDAEDPYAN